MKKLTNIIFDMDGTLYQFSPGQHLKFNQTKFYADLYGRILDFVGTELGLTPEQTVVVIDKIDTEFNGELSTGFEKTYGIDRLRYFLATWGCEPSVYITPDPELPKAMSDLSGKALLLTAAPRVWTVKTLTHLGVRDVFGDRIMTGDPDIRKPDVRVFKQAAAALGVDPTSVISVGDQNESDILPAKSLGMTTIMVGPHKGDADHHVGTVHEAITLIKERLL